MFEQRNTAAITAAMLLAAAASGQVGQTLAPVVDFDGNFSALPGAQLLDSFATDTTETSDTIQIDTMGEGGLGVGVAPADFDSSAAQIRIRARLLPGNEAESIVIGLVDNDGDDSGEGLGNEDWNWRVSIEELDESGFTDLVFSLGSVGLSRNQNTATTNDGDEVANFGFEYFLLQTESGNTARLAIEIDEISIEQVCLTADYVLADYGPGFLRGGFDSFGDEGVLTETANSLIIDTSLSDNSNDFGGTARGFPGEETAIPGSRYQVRVTARLLPGNEVGNFQVVIGDLDGPNAGENYEYNILTSAFNETDFADFTVPLNSPSRVGENFAVDGEGDDILNLGAFEWLLQSTFGSTDALNIEIKEIVIEPILSLPAIELAVFDDQIGNLPGIFTFASFAEGGALPTSDSLIIDTDANGGLGANNGTTREVDANSTMLEVVGRALPGNAATQFAFSLIDTDGDDDEPGTGLEEWQFPLFTADFGANPDGTVDATGDFITWTRPLAETPGQGGIFRQMAQGIGAMFDGDMIQNYGLYQWQLGYFGSPTNLTFEIQSIRLLPQAPSYIDPDLDMSGDRDFVDALAYLAAPQELDNQGETDANDLQFFLDLLKCACP